MVDRIRVLPDQVQNLIAAGEVVERPASVVKELVENAVDAGARSIEITVEGGGRTRVVVADDGTGMTPEDAPRSLARHATSKLWTANDLGRIETLGFRGEALPAIASVSDLTLVTRPQDADRAIRVEVRYGGKPQVREDARGTGTTVEVRNLFARTPARAKFLKSNATETRWIVQVFTAYAMAYPEIALSLTVEGRRQGRFHAVADRLQRVRDVIGPAPRWTRFGTRGRTFSFEGLLSEPDGGRSAPSHIFFFVNRRWVSNRSLMQTLLRAYSPFLARGRYPSAVIYVDVPPGAVDVNVHPTKREVRFREDRQIRDALFRTIEEQLRTLRRGRLGAAEGPRPSGAEGVQETGADYRTSAPATQLAAPLVLEDGRDIAAGPEKEGPRLIATLAHTYLVAVDGEDLVLVDQHAAHERILFEEAIRALEGERTASQALLLPLTLDLTPEEAQTFEGSQDEIRRIGFDVRPFGGRSILVEAVPAGLRRWENGQVFRDILDEMGRSSERQGERVALVAASFACHASVRAGDSLSPDERSRLLARLFCCKDWHRCPHGRPTVIRIDRAEVERRFRRP